MKRHQLDGNKVELAYARIKDLVVNYRFGACGHLQINELSEQLNVSVTPVREALFQLQAEGLIASVPHRGFFTKGLDVKELRNLHELALVVLGHSLRQASRKELSPGPLLALDREVSRLPGRRAQAALEATYIEGLFESIVRLSDNGEMIAIIDAFNNKSHFIRVIDLETDCDRARLREEVSELTSQLRAGNAVAAIENLNRQFDGVQERMADLVKEALARIYLSAAKRPLGMVELHRARSIAAN